MIVQSWVLLEYHLEALSMSPKGEVKRKMFIELVEDEVEGGGLGCAVRWF